MTAKYPDFEGETELNLETLQPFLHNLMWSLLTHGNIRAEEADFLKAQLYRCSPYERRKRKNLDSRSMAVARWDGWDGEEE